MSDLVLANILGPDAVIVLVLAVVLLFGAGQIPKLARSVGEASKELKKVKGEAESELQQTRSALQQGRSEPPPGT
jgi:sec-independent protein translocase protein TatA